ncbi:MAG: ABC transporter permease [Proteobacteria bacterium]|jgi:spermidine/putrescine transport system permease protein|nr:ABC transporter permease [Pseudomonadota bacterium]MBT5190578.1 ABC transporter permease [Pseudomonadota bacterium]MBT7671203.1 ABC transporter permease [Pseudomonadota bacterium]MBT7812193.1 ABC transporter permease [Pseudomonadota bacterium]MBT7966484.1 ABC transporter permease [Pseudomonadota bacterium]
MLPVGHYRGLSAWTVGFFIFLYLPIVVLIFYSFNANRMVMNWGGFGIDWYIKAFNNADIQKAVWNSLVVATVATGVATAIATIGALVLARGGNFRGKTASLGLITLPLMVPEIVTAVAVLIFFSAIGMNLGLGNVIIAHITFCIPFAFMPIRARLEGMDTNLEQAARDLYASEWETFRFVTMPLLMPGIVAGAMLSFVISMDDFIITLMVGGAGSTTLPVYIYSMIRRGLTPEINAVSTMLLLASIAIVTAYWILSKKTQNTVKR